MRCDFRQSWLERVAVLTVASLCITGCAGGGGGDSTTASDSGMTVGGTTDGSTPSNPTTDTPSSNPGTQPAANQAPTLSGTPVAAVVIDTEYSFQFAASDADGDVLTLAVQNLPSWAQLDTDSQRLTGTPTAGDTGTYSNIVISASDGKSTVTMPAFTIQVVPVAMGQVTVSWHAPTTNTNGTPLTDLAGYKIYFGNSSDNLNRSVLVDNVGLSSYVIDNLTPATYFFAVTALNRAGTESARSTLVNKTL